MGLHDIRCFSACRHVEFDTFVICRVFMHRLGSFLTRDMLQSLHEFSFEGTKHAIRLSKPER